MNFVDRAPGLQLICIATWCAFLFTYPVGFFTKPLCAIANITGLIRKTGYPKFSIEFL